MLSNLDLTVDDFTNSNWQNVLNEVDAIICDRYRDAFFNAAREAEESNKEKEREIFLLLGHLCTMILRPDDPTGPLKPLFVFETSRAATVQDFPEQYLITLSQILPNIIDPELKARVGDVIWIRLGDFEAAQAAVEGYLDSVIRLLGEEGATQIHASYRIKRAIKLGASLGHNHPTYQRVIDFIEDLVSEESTLRHDGIFIHLIELLIKYRAGDPEAYAVRTEAIAQEFEDDQNWLLAQRFWEFKSDWERLAGNEEASRQARINAAEAYVSHAQTLANSDSEHAYSQAQFYVKQAITAYRRLGHSQQRVQELIQLLRNYQRNSIDDVGIYSIKLNSSDLMDEARKHVSNQDFLNSLLRLAFIVDPPNVSSLREFVVSLVHEHPLLYFIAAQQMTEDGRVVGVRPSVDTDEERAILNEMYRQALLQYHSHAAELIWPAAHQVKLEHSIREDTLLPLLRNNPLVPPGREIILAKGLVAGFEGEFAIAIHLLIPQLENSLRYILFQNGVEISKYDDQGIQDVILLGEILYEPKLKEALDDNLIFTLRCLLHERFGGNLRNDLLHGLMSVDGMYSAIAVYTWWLTFHFYMLPIRTNVLNIQQADQLDQVDGESKE